MKKTVLTTIIMLIIIAILGGCVNAAASISTSTKTVKEGETVKITVSFGEKVSAAQFTLSFDSSKFEYVSKSSGGSFSSATKKFAYTSEDGVTADLASVTFTFKAKSEGSANFSISGLKISTATQTKVTPSISSSSTSVKVEAEKVETPTTPSEPETPSTPNTPSTPSTPSTPTTPSTPSTPSTNTGSSSNSGSTSSGNTSSTKPSTNKNNTTTNTQKVENKVENTVENTISNNEEITNTVNEIEIENTIIDENIVDVNETIDTSVRIPEDNQNEKNNNIILYVIAGIAIIAIVGVGITIIVKKRKVQDIEAEKIKNKYKE